MRVKILQFIALCLAALTLAPLYAHVLEWPGKRELTGAEWLAAQHHLYGGYAISGAITEILGLLATLILAFLVRHRRRAFVLTVIAVLCYAGMLAAFAFGNNPINQQIASWTPATMPASWPQARDAWQAFHAISAAMAAVAFGVLLASAIWLPSRRNGMKRE